MEHLIDKLKSIIDNSDGFNRFKATLLLQKLIAELEPKQDIQTCLK